MNDVNLHEKIIIHLRKYCNVAGPDELISPLEVTQDGIAMVLGISRNHTSVILSKMQRNGEVDFKISRIRYSESGIRRKAYHLTAKGLECYDRVINRLIDEGLDPKDAMVPGNINYYSGEMMDSIPVSDMDVIGMVSLIRVAVHKNQLSAPLPKCMPLDGHGMAFIRLDTRERILTRASDANIKRWHSLAADWCSENCTDIRERLFHLMESGRTFEAEKLVNKNRYLLMDNPSKDLIPGILNIARSSDDPNITYVVAMMGVRTRAISETREAIVMLRHHDDVLADAMESELALELGNNTEALELALHAYRGDMETGLALGKSMACSKRYNEALVFLHKSRMDMYARKCVFRMNEALLVEAGIMDEIGRGECKDELEHLACDLTMTLDPGELPPGM